LSKGGVSNEPLMMENVDVGNVMDRQGLEEEMENSHCVKGADEVE